MRKVAFILIVCMITMQVLPFGNTPQYAYANCRPGHVVAPPKASSGAPAHTPIPRATVPVAPSPSATTAPVQFRTVTIPESGMKISEAVISNPNQINSKVYAASWTEDFLEWCRKNVKGFQPDLAYLYDGMYINYWGLWRAEYTKAMEAIPAPYGMETTYMYAWPTGNDPLLYKVGDVIGPNRPGAGQVVQEIRLLDPGSTNTEARFAVYYAPAGSTATVATGGDRTQPPRDTGSSGRKSGSGGSTQPTTQPPTPPQTEPTTPSTDQPQTPPKSTFDLEQATKGIREQGERARAEYKKIREDIKSEQDWNYWVHDFHTFDAAIYTGSIKAGEATKLVGTAAAITVSLLAVIALALAASATATAATAATAVAIGTAGKVLLVVGTVLTIAGTASSVYSVRGSGGDAVAAAGVQITVQVLTMGTAPWAAFILSDVTTPIIIDGVYQATLENKVDPTAHGYGADHLRDS